MGEWFGFVSGLCRRWLRRRQWTCLVNVIRLPAWTSGNLWCSFPCLFLDFLCIHPFRDGNGRIARLLTLLLLYHFNYDVGRYISLERIFERTRESYYETLEVSSKGWHEVEHDVNPWLNYFWGVMQSAYNEFEERVGHLGTGRGSKTAQVRDAVQRKLGSFAISDLEHDCPGVSKETIRNVLQQLRDEGVVELRGRGRGARWRLK